ncbi:MAG: CARDB domain-containing protein [Haloferacaceae archaeon]
MPSSQPSGRAVAVLATLCLLVAGLGAAVPAADARSSSAVSVTNVTYTPDTPTAGEQFTLRVTIANHGDGTGTFRVSEVYARGLSNTEYIAEEVGALPPGTSTTITLPVTFERAGWHTFAVHVNGQVYEGGIVNIEHPVTLKVADEQRPQVELSTGEAVPGATRPVNVTVANGGRTDVRQVAVTVDSPTANFTLTRRVRARIEGGNATTFRFPASVAESGTYPVNVTVTYTERGERHRFVRTFPATFDGPASPGEIRLTGVDAVARGGTLELSATASNVGSTPVDGVVVSVGDAPNVGSADYFVGSVDASDFSSFTLSASLAGNVSTVPVDVRYVVDGVERSFTTTVPVERATVERPEPSGGGGPPLVGIAGALVVLLGAAVTYRWRR